MQANTFLIDRAYENLANAIVESAVTEYRNALKGLTYDKRMSPECVIETLETFFHSSYFSMLTKLNPEYLISKLREEHEKEKEQL